MRTVTFGFFCSFTESGAPFVVNGAKYSLIQTDSARHRFLPDRSLVVIEIIKPAHLERTVVRAIPRANAAVVGHDVETVFAVHGCVHRANRFARRILAVLAHHRLMHHLRFFRNAAPILIEILFVGEIAIDPHPMHGAAVRDLKFADDRNVIFALAGNDARAATGADIQIHRHPPLLRRGHRRMGVEGRQTLRQVLRRP